MQLKWNYLKENCSLYFVCLPVYPFIYLRMNVSFEKGNSLINSYWYYYID